MMTALRSIFGWWHRGSGTRGHVEQEEAALRTAIERHTKGAREEEYRAHQEVGSSRALNGVLKQALSAVKHGEKKDDDH
jgi:hypothetical protein